ncbi:TM2 domain containing protein [Richelia sinica FACHB-800]|uniref:TM2 domain containing protein n=2 Tax=Richelia TaxID=98443 RepID=A0A975Y6M2_9NOST|nr:TM2 domain containing protein [Richelia sinica FACHB-800]
MNSVGIWRFLGMKFTKRKSRSIAAILAFSGTVTISGLHKFYLGQPLWGILYVLLSWTPIPKVASAIEGVWYLAQDDEVFDRNFNFGQAVPKTSLPVSSQVESVASALRELDALRQDGLISEYEFEQKRRQMLDQIS